jgi:hypothetical protein
MYADATAKSHRSSSPLMGEGWGEGEYNVISVTFIPLPFIFSREGRVNSTFGQTINVKLYESRRFTAT